ncbi:putative lipoprotein [Hyphomonas neptunium ATCC 15444]|uniref:Putative lipoprotein n=2 Tax=Hyphomonas TaxID=85 RepID=Q0BXA2_HYPNA|nr:MULTISPECIES: hypothetical protein [Hyphomonas]ABI76693.1 putative lipoprotein [Hyphomonas neptunium ATCC 15444]KCZ86914.1 putative lipoprotein [Hyphomonas hirschiana VP5]
MRTFLISIACAGLAACSAGDPSALTASLQSDPPGPGHEIGGSVDSVDYDASSGTVTISGWHMFTPETKQQDLKVYADTAVSVASVSRFERPDVVDAVGNEDLKDAGFTLVLKTDPGAPLTELCISMTDKHYGARILHPVSREQVRCASVGQ